MENKLSHFDINGNAVMVDVSNKNDTDRVAVAHGFIKLSKEAFEEVLNGKNKKGDVLSVARLAGIMGIKRTSDLIPLCHILLLTHSSIDFVLHEEENVIEAVCTVKTNGKTGVEMEALCGVNITLLTVYDMCKAVDKSMRMYGIELLEKSGGKSGLYKKC